MIPAHRNPGQNNTMKARSVVQRTLGMIRAGHNPKYLIQRLQKAAEALSSVKAEAVVLFLHV